MRGWTEGVDPVYISFVEEMRATGVEVADIHVLPAGFPNFGAWANAIVETINSRRREDESIHLMGYCFGGNLLLAVLAEFERRGISPAYVALIDARMASPIWRLRWGYDALYQAPWPVRFRGLLIRLTPPDRESFVAVTASVVRRSVRSVRELPQRGWRSRRRRRPEIYDELSRSFAWEYEAITTPVHCYNTEESKDRFAAGDPSLLMGRYLQGGYVIRMIEGDHGKCIAPPYSTLLIKKITTDRTAVVQGVGPFQ